VSFSRYIGIDYSDAQTPESRLKSLQVYEATRDGEPVKISTPADGAKNWSRLEIAQYCLKALESDEPAIIGIDHGFSFPMSYMQRYGISSWDDFLKDFMRHWPTADPLPMSIMFAKTIHVRVIHQNCVCVSNGRLQPRVCSCLMYRVQSPNQHIQGCRGCYGCGKCRRAIRAFTSGHLTASRYRRGIR
jgi:hypothetical protein